jgi:ATP-dependent Lon protease
LLEAQTRADTLRLTHSYLAHELQVLELRSKIASSAQTEMGKEQREYLLRQQMRAIQQELGERNPEQAESVWKKRTCRKKSTKKCNASCRGWRDCLRPHLTTT